MSIVRKTPWIAAAAAVLLIPAAVLSASNPTNCGFSGGDAARGKTIYKSTCVACHGVNGRGTIPGVPDFNKKGGVLTKPHSALADHIERGFKSPSSPMAMPARGGNPKLTAQDLRDVHSYLHDAFGCGR